MNATDICILIISAYYFIGGWQKGFLRTIFGPIALILGSILSYYYYKQTGNLVISILIGLIVPFALNIILSLMIGIWQKSNDEEKEMFTLGSLLGAICNLVWGLTITSLMIFLFLLVPLQISTLQQCQENIHQSQYYSFLNKKFSLDLRKDAMGLDSIQEILKDPKKIERLQNSDGFQALINDERMQKIFNNEKTVSDMKSNNFGELLKNPDFMQLLNDQELTAKILKAYKDMIKFDKKDQNENSE
jgi:hypothetical protein